MFDAIRDKLTSAYAPSRYLLAGYVIPIANAAEPSRSSADGDGLGLQSVGPDASAYVFALDKQLSRKF